MPITAPGTAYPKVVTGPPPATSRPAAELDRVADEHREGDAGDGGDRGDDDGVGEVLAEAAVDGVESVAARRCTAQPASRSDGHEEPTPEGQQAAAVRQHRPASRGAGSGWTPGPRPGWV